MRVFSDHPVSPVSPVMLSLLHEGHGQPGQGHTLVHYLSEPVHLVAIALMIAVIAAVWFWFGRISLAAPARRDRNRR
jgi:hypothetical protein